MEKTEAIVDYAALLDGVSDDFEADDPLGEVIDSVHLGAPVTAKLNDDGTKAADELPAWTPAELDAMSEEFTEDDIKRALATSSEPLRELLRAKESE